MCDEHTAADMAASTALSRREFVGTGAATAALIGAAGTAWAAPAGLAEAMVTVPIAGAQQGADAFFVHPANGRHPAIILWPDIAGLREAYKVMARRLAGAGYAVLVVNQYYRSQPAPVLSGITEYMTPAGQAKMKPMIAPITPDGVLHDAAACVAFLDAQRAVDTKRAIGSSGYCMTGSYTVRAAAAVPDRVKAACSFHGAGLVTAAADSPHLQIAKSHASFLFCIARNDDARAPGDKDALRAAATAAARPAEIEVYAADHGWCTLDAPSYNHAEAERAWARMLVHFAEL